jgi:thiamine-monophosphate kinase
MKPGPGEFERIRRIIAELGPLASGIGDDCAIVPDGSGRLVVSTDLSVEGVHFRTQWLTLKEIGWRAAVSSLSDLAAEGASVVGLLASLGVPRSAGETDLTEVMAGVGAAVGAVGGAVLGGDLSRADQWLIDVVSLGRAARPVTRAGARPGDQLWLTGRLGGARAALAAWQRRSEPAPAAREAFAHPLPRIRSGLALAQSGATAMIDLSDGLGGDAAHLAADSAALLEIDLSLVPIHPDVPPEAQRERIPAGQFAALGGEDYELLAAMPVEFSAVDSTRIAAETGVALTRIGRVAPGSGVRLLLEGEPLSLPGFDHFV